MILGGVGGGAEVRPGTGTVGRGKGRGLCSAVVLPLAGEGGIGAMGRRGVLASAPCHPNALDRTPQPPRTHLGARLTTMYR